MSSWKVLTAWMCGCSLVADERAWSWCPNGCEDGRMAGHDTIDMPDDRPEGLMSNKETAAC